MSITALLIGLAMLVALALIAKERKYLLTSASLMVMASALATGFIAAYLIVG